MQRTNSFVARAKAIVFTAVVIVGEFIRSSFPEQDALNNLPRTLLIGVYIALIYILFEVLQWALSAMIQNSRLLRMLIEGREFVEGTWIDLVYTEEQPDIITGGVLDIEVVGGEFIVTGDSYAEDGRRIGQFRSIVAKHNVDRTRFSFTKFDYANDVTNIPGFSDYMFRRRSPFPKEFDGYFFKEGSTEKFFVYGRKATRQERKEIKDSADQGVLVGRFIAENRSVVRFDT